MAFLEAKARFLRTPIPVPFVGDPIHTSRMNMPNPLQAVIREGTVPQIATTRDAVYKNPRVVIDEKSQNVTIEGIAEPRGLRRIFGLQAQDRQVSLKTIGRYELEREKLTISYTKDDNKGLRRFIRFQLRFFDPVEAALRNQF